jgi:hypothetical protein
MRRRSARGKAARCKGVAGSAARDPALWAWAVVALLALLPLREAITARSVPAAAEVSRFEAPAAAPIAERSAMAPQG